MTLAAVYREALPTPDVVGLRDAQEVALCGGKAAALARMVRVGLAVPPGFVVTDAAFQRFVAGKGLVEPIAAALDGLDASDTGPLGDAAQRIRNLILTAPISAPLAAALTVWRNSLLPGETLIVRSSAVGEDSAHASFAGQLDSIAGVTDEKGLAAALRACWASYWSERALCYQRARGVRLRGMGVVIQREVKAHISGVLFTTSVKPGADHEMLLEYCFGPGELLVSGRVDPGRVALSRNGACFHHEVAPQQQEQDGSALLNDVRIAALASAGLACEAEFGGSQDIEWVIGEDGKLYLVQSRPITAAPVPVATRVVWSNANVNENFPQPISPLLYSIAAAGYSRYFHGLGSALGISRRRLRAMRHLLHYIIGVHGARMYYNLTNIHAVLRMAPCGDLLCAWFNEFVGARERPTPPPAALRFAKESRVRQVAELVRIALKTTWQYLFLPRRVEAFERAASAFAARTHPLRLASRNAHELRDDLRAFLDIRLHCWTGAALADCAAMVCYGALKQLINRAFPEAEAGALHNNLLKGLPDVVSSVPPAKLWDLSRTIRADARLASLFAGANSGEILTRIETGDFPQFRAELDEFIEQWGFRYSGELMLTVPSFQDHPAALLDILRAYVKLEGESPQDTLSRQKAGRLAETARIIRELSRQRLLRFSLWPSRAPLTKLMLRFTQRAIALRERARLKQALLYNRVRRIALALGAELVKTSVLVARDDVFFLTWQELDTLLAGSAMFPHRVKELIGLRKSEHAELAAMNPPDSFSLPEGEYLALAVDAAASGYHPAQKQLRGTGVCGGRATGRAAVLEDVTQSHRLAPGDILVTRQTDPGWAPLFFLIKGLVMERGGMLSHGAILAREYGIPTVVGAAKATRLIESGATVTVDGDRGVVEVNG
ncbi:MAG: PEP/pyruvate-binding domain-containing protein [Burkholderiales bacterium]